MSTLLQWREPLWLLLALLPGLLLVFAYVLHRRQHSSYADPHLRDWAISSQRTQRQRRWWQFLFTQLAWCAFALAMAGPRIPVNYFDTQQQHTTQLLVVIDVSASMSARDVSPSRIERIKLELLDLTERLQHTQMGLIVYAAQAHVLTSPTGDKGVLREYIRTLRTGLLPTAGSQTLAALDYARTQFRPASDISKAILLISDGEHHVNAQTLDASLPALAARFKQQHIYIYTLGIGSPQGAAILTGDRGFLSFDNAPVVSRLNAPFLQRLAELGNGRYARVTDDDSDWEQLYVQGIAQLPLASVQTQQDERVQWRELFHGFVLAGLLLLVIAHWQPNAHVIQTVWLLPILTVVLLTTSQPTRAAEPTYADAYRFYAKGDYQTARRHFAMLTGFQARFAEASSAYQLQEYKQAVPLFIHAILQADAGQQRSAAIFNLANCYFKLDRYTQARQLYLDVLRYQPDHRAAQINLGYATALEQQARPRATTKAVREGTGPRTADAPPEMEFVRGRLSLGDATGNPPEQTIPENNTAVPQSSTQLLQQSRPASEQIEYSKDLRWTYDITSLSALHLEYKQQTVDESILWQRLFEHEEGFMAPQEEPKTLPGVKPW